MTDREAPELVFCGADDATLEKAEERIAALLPDAERHAGSAISRVISRFRTSRLVIDGPARIKSITMMEHGPLGHAFLQVDEHADGGDMLDVTNTRPRRGRHIHDLNLRDRNLSIVVETHGRLDGVASSRAGAPAAVHRMLSLSHVALRAARTGRVAASDMFRHAAASRLAEAGNPEPTVRMNVIGGGTPLVVPAVDVMWPTPVTPARCGIVDRDIDVWALNDPLDSGLPTTWEIEVVDHDGSMKVEIRPLVTRLPQPANPVEIMRGEAAFAAAA